MNPVLVTMRGERQIGLSDLSNFEAGIAFLSLVSRLYPGIKFGDLPSLVAERMGRSWFRRAGHAVASAGRGAVDYAGNVTEDIGKGLKEATSEITEGVGDILRDTFSVAGDQAGSAIRLLTDEKIVDGISRYGAAYATKGGSEGIRNLFQGSDAGEGLLAFISQLGSSFKAVPSNVEPKKTNYLPWVIGGGAVLATLLLVGRK